MTTSRLLCSLFAAASGLVGQVSDQELVGNVFGRVVDSASGRGIARASVRLTGTTFSATTDANGRFLIPGVPTPYPGREYGVSVSANGYLPRVSQKVLVLPGAVMALECRVVLGHTSFAPSAMTFSYAHERPARGVRSQAGRVFATREGLTGRTTANGHVIRSGDRFVALPSRRALARNGSREYLVRVSYNGRSAIAPVWDIGPWNIRDDYWMASSKRERFQNLPQGKPEAQAAYLERYNGGRDGFGRKVTNPAGIDLADGVFWNDLRMRNNDWVAVEYLWDVPLISKRPEPQPGPGRERDRRPQPTARRAPPRVPPSLGDLISIAEIILRRR